MTDRCTNRQTELLVFLECKDQFTIIYVSGAFHSDLNHKNCFLKLMNICIYTGYKLVRQFSLPAEAVRHIWLPLKLSAISCFLPLLLCTRKMVFCRDCPQDKNHADVLDRKPFFADSIFGRKQEIADRLGGS